MTRLSKGTIVVAAALGATLFVLEPASVRAQCATCVTPTVAYSPVVVPTAVVQPTVVRTGWYPGRFFDRLRLNRWGMAAAAPTYTAAYAPAATYATSYAPTYTAAYAPAYTSAYAPAATYTAAYTPYITAYAPLQSTVVQTSYAPAVAAPACTSCAPTVTTSYAPSVVYRPVEVAPVVETAVVAPACPCTPADPCGACATCAPVATQAVYTEAAAPACPSCAAAPAGQVIYQDGASGQSGATVGPQTPQPALKPEVAAPANGQYPPEAPPADETKAQEESSVVPDPKPEADENNAAPVDGASTSLEFPTAPPLIAPQNGDRITHRPTVDVHNAVYRQPARPAQVSTMAAKPAVRAASAPAIDANGWVSVLER